MKHAFAAPALAGLVLAGACAQPATKDSAATPRDDSSCRCDVLPRDVHVLPGSDRRRRSGSSTARPSVAAEVLKNGGYIGGFVRAAKEYDNVELVGILSPRDAKGGSSGSWITREAFDKYSNGIADDIRQTGPYDGVFLALHGAMAVTGVPKPEAELVRRVRAVVGPKVPIYVTLDLHANDDHELSDAASGVLIIKRYPHYDAALQGERALRLMLRTIKGTFTPTMATRKPGVLTPSVFQGTGTSPSMEIMERARIWEERTRDAYVSVAYGFAYADVPDVGATVMVITNNDQKLADRIADDMSDFIWKKREEFAGKTLPEDRGGRAAGDRGGESGQGAGGRGRSLGPDRQLDVDPRRAHQAGREELLHHDALGRDARWRTPRTGRRSGDAVCAEHRRLGRADVGQAGEDRRHARVAGQVRTDGPGGGDPVRRQQPGDPDAGPPPGDRSRHLPAARHRPRRSSTSSCSSRGSTSGAGSWRTGWRRRCSRWTRRASGRPTCPTIPYKFAPRTLYPIDRNAKKLR